MRAAAPRVLGRVEKSQIGLHDIDPSTTLESNKSLIYMRYTTVTCEAQTRQLFASHRVVCIAPYGRNSPSFSTLVVLRLDKVKKFLLRLHNFVCTLKPDSEGEDRGHHFGVEKGKQ